MSIESYRPHDSPGYHSSGKLQRIYHITYNNNVRQLAYVDTLEWTANNISQLKRTFILQPGKNFVDTYMYDDKPHAFKDLQTTLYNQSIDASTLPANNIIRETRKEVVSGTVKVNVFTYTYTDNRIAKKISDTQFGGWINAKDTFYYDYILR
jgi:hypothetical protein